MSPVSLVTLSTNILLNVTPVMEIRYIIAKPFPQELYYESDVTEEGKIDVYILYISLLVQRFNEICELKFELVKNPSSVL